MAHAHASGCQSTWLMPAIADAPGLCAMCGNVGMGVESIGIGMGVGIGTGTGMSTGIGRGIGTGQAEA